jgi:hypothetical protein
VTTPEATERLREALNRPQDDDLFVYPDEYYTALSKAQRYYYRQIAQHAPELLYVTTTITTADSGRTYDLDADHYGEIELWAPPGPPTGDLIYPSLPEQRRYGWYIEKQKVKLTVAKVYSPGIYVRYIPANPTDVDGDTDPLLPNYFDEALIARAAYGMALKPGFLGDPRAFKKLARDEWSGDPDDPSDLGLLAILKNQATLSGLAAVPDDNLIWYKNIDTGT